MLNDLDLDMSDLFDCLNNPRYGDRATAIVSDIIFKAGENMSPATISLCLASFFANMNNALVFLRKAASRQDERRKAATAHGLSVSSISSSGRQFPAVIL